MNKFFEKFASDSERKKFQKQAAQQICKKKYPDVKLISNVYYGDGFEDSNKSVKYKDDSNYCMDIFKDNKNKAKYPIIISIHGGSFMTGSKEFNHPMCFEFASNGYLVYDLEYPKIPECTIDELLEAIVAAMNEIGHSATSLNGDTENVFIVGDSAGALLSVYATAILHNQKLAKELGLGRNLSGIRIKAMGLLSGLYYTTTHDFYGFFFHSLLFGKELNNNTLKKYKNPEISDVIDTLPPCILTTCEKDILKKNTLLFYKALQDKGIHCELEFYSDKTLVHDFPMFQCERPEAEEVYEKVLKFFEKV